MTETIEGIYDPGGLNRKVLRRAREIIADEARFCQGVEALTHDADSSAMYIPGRDWGSDEEIMSYLSGDTPDKDLYETGYRDPTACQWCARAALDKALVEIDPEGRKYSEIEELGNKCGTAAYEALCYGLAPDYQKDDEIEYTPQTEFGGMIEALSDHFEHDQVLEGFDRAIRLLVDEPHEKVKVNA